MGEQASFTGPVPGPFRARSRHWVVKKGHAPGTARDGGAPGSARALPVPGLTRKVADSEGLSGEGSP